MSQEATEAVGGPAEESSEWRKPKALTAPMRVIAEEREKHELTHVPYRAWYKFCVWARGRNTAHRKKVEESGGVPRICLDYHFMGTDDAKASENPIWVVVNEPTGEKFARLVGRKGMGQEGEMDWVVKDLVE